MPREKNAPGFVYLVRDGNIHKIGSSSNPRVRMLQVAGPGAVLVHTIPSANPYKVENALQRHFRFCPASGRGREWFDLDAEDIAAICKLGRVDTVNDLPEELRPVPDVPVQIQKDVARMLRTVSAYKGIPFPAFFDQLVRDAIRDRYRNIV